MILPKRFFVTESIMIFASVRKKTAEKGKSFAKNGKDSAVRLLDSAKGRFNNEKT